MLMMFCLCDPMPRGYLPWLLLSTRRRYYGQMLNVHALQIFRVYTLAVTSALPSTKLDEDKIPNSSCNSLVRDGEEQLI